MTATARSTTSTPHAKPSRRGLRAARAQGRSCRWVALTTACRTRSPRSRPEWWRLTVADGRFISHSLGDSEKYSALEDPRYQVVYVLLVAWADAEGRFIADPVTVNGKLLTRITWSTPAIVKEALQACHHVGLIRLYEVEDKPYGYIEKFHQHNK